MSPTVRQMRVEAPSGVPARLGLFAVILAIAVGGGWAAGQSVGPVRLPADPAAVHTHLEAP